MHLAGTSHTTLGRISATYLMHRVGGHHHNSLHRCCYLPRECRVSWYCRLPMCLCKHTGLRCSRPSKSQPSEPKDRSVAHWMTTSSRAYLIARKGSNELDVTTCLPSGPSNPGQRQGGSDATSRRITSLEPCRTRLHNEITPLKERRKGRKEEQKCGIPRPHGRPFRNYSNQIN